MPQGKKNSLEDTTRVSRKGPAQALPKDKVFSLTVTAGPLKGKSFAIPKPKVTLGRSPANDIVVDDPGVSRVHCVFEIRGPVAALVDLDSANGTFVEDQRIKTFQLESLSDFRIGDTTLMLVIRDKEE